MIEYLIETTFDNYKKRGLIYRIPCVLHNESEPSMDINLDPKSEFYGLCRCWGCKKTITVKELANNAGWGIENLDPALISKKFFFKKKLSEGEKHFKLKPNKTQTKQLQPNKLPDDFRVFFSNPNDVYEKLALDYLRKRGFDDQTIMQHSIGYIPYNQTKYSMSIIIPFYNETMKPVYFIARKMFEPNIRYINLENKEGFVGRNNVVFNFFGLMLAEKIIVCEGAFNAMAWNQALRNFPEVQAIATNGSEASASQLGLLLTRSTPREIILAYDYNTDTHTKKLYSQLLGICPISMITFDSALDANDILRTDRGEGLINKFKQRKLYSPNILKGIANHKK